MIADLAVVAAMPGNPRERAEALLAVLQRLTHFDAGYLVLLDAERRLLTPLARRGYPDRVQRFLDGTAMFDDLERIGLQRHRPPMQLPDLPVPPLSLPAWAQYLYPAGFAGGIGVALSTSDGRFVGQFGANSASREPLPAGLVAVLARVAPLIADAIDPLRTVITAAGLVGDAEAGVIVDPAGDATALPGLPGHPLLSTGSPVLAVARAELDGGRIHAAFLCPSDSTPSGLVRITVLGPVAGGLERQTIVVLLSPSPDLRGLTLRELQILGLLTEGWPNARIAHALTVAERTVESHVEHILLKRRASSRTMAAVGAHRQGIYVPAALTEPPGR